MFNKLCIIGVGLIGGSVARAARANGLANTIIGIGRIEDIDNLRQAKELGVIDKCYVSKLLTYPNYRKYFSYCEDLSEINDFGSLEDALYQADCVVIAIPVSGIKILFTFLKNKGRWSNHTLYTDVGSTKGNVIAAAESVFGYAPSNLVPAHPIAGAEKSGVQASIADLFLNRRLIITPVSNTNPIAVDTIKLFWEGLGAFVSIMEVQKHDNILAATSHLPHLLAFALVDMLRTQDETNSIFEYAAGGFKDFTRIASSDPNMWQAICVANKDELIPLLEEFQQELNDIREMLKQKDSAGLFNLFSNANLARQRFMEQSKT